MRAPSNAQAALLALIAEHEEAGRDVEWMAATTETLDRPSRARLYIEVIDREKNTSRFIMADGWTYAHRVATVRACLRLGWLADLHQRTVRFPKHRYQRRDHVRDLRQLDLTEDGVIALGLWRERKLNAPPAPLPTLSTREREIVELAQRAHELGYALCAREPVRLEARRMRRAGWFGECWVANSATGLVPTPMAVVEVRPDDADRYPSQRSNDAPSTGANPALIREGERAMNFRPELAEKVMSGEKTVTRRLMSPNPRSPWFDGGCSLKVDRTYAVCPGRGKNAIGRVRVIDVRQEALGIGHAVRVDIAREEGFATPEEFKAAWAEINGDFIFGSPVWRIEFEVDDQSSERPADTPARSTGDAESHGKAGST